MAASFMLTISVALVAFLSRPTPSRLLLVATAPKQIVVGDTAEVRLLVQSNPRKPLKIRLDRRLLADFQLIGIDPLPIRFDSHLDFYDLILPMEEETQPVVLRFKGVREGEYIVQVTVMTKPNDATHWKARVVVLKEPPPPSPAKRLSLLAMWQGR